ncbi:MAG: phosphoglucosamine mutase [Thermoleophilia bacterium]|nr:phosphoglucosamine mutase [Thermoleophilia bacterium]MDH4341028.1 phosphoglucosamine mutase [Thermoleophilia bacterium]MDH5282133.1 phosphoglucosamine mutase [Thermoleophilia bacterium]
MGKRRYFGTDGVRGVVGDDLTPELVERLGKAATLWAGAGRVLVGRDTRASGVEFEEALARGIASAGGTAVLAGVLPTPAIALEVEDLGAVISASHNPPEYNGVKFFDGEGRKLTNEDEEAIEALLDARSAGGGAVENLEGVGERYAAKISERFGSDLSGLRVGVDCANGAFSSLAPRAFEQLGAEVTAIGVEPDGNNINVGCGATDLTALQQTVTSDGLDLGVAFDGDGDRMLAVDERGESLDGDQILAVLALALAVDVVVVTVMTNLGFHRLMAERRIRVVTTPVGDRYVLEALRDEGGLLGGEQSGHIIWLGSHVTGDGLAAALLLCSALRGRKLSEAAAIMQRYPQAQRNVRVARSDLPQSVLDEVDRVSAELGEGGRVLVRPSGTEPVVRVLAEMENAQDAERMCVSIAALVERELG